jgi:DNA polymerase III subunit beta
MLTIKAGVLQNALQTTSGAVHKNLVNEILSAVLVKFDNGMTFSATNRDLSIKTKVLEYNGSLDDFCIEHETFFNAIKGYSVEDILELSIEKSGELPILNIKKGRSTSKIQLLNTDNFPATQTPCPTHTVNFNKEDLRNAINFTKSTIYANETRYNINGLCFAFKQGLVEVVSTDGNRLGLIKVEDSEVDFERKLTMPRKAILELSKILANATVEIKMHIAESLVAFEFNNTMFLTKLIDAQFPDYNRVIPTNTNIVIKVQRKELLNAVDRVNSLFIKEEAIAINFVVNENTIELNAKKDTGKNERNEILDATSNESINFKINGLYLKEALSGISSKEVQIKCTLPNAPLIIQGAEESNALYTIMPVK